MATERRAVFAACLALATLGTSACRTAKCRDQTVLVTLGLTGDARMAAQVRAVMSIGESMAPDQHFPLQGPDGGTFEIDFPNGYPQGSRLNISLYATSAAGQQLGAAMAHVQLTSICETLSMYIGSDSDGGCLLACPPDACGTISNGCGGTLECAPCEDAGVDGDATMSTTGGFLSDATVVAGGAGHACAIVSGGKVKCWGLNETGQLGTGDVTPAGDPQSVLGLPTTATALALGVSHSCALRDNGAVYCWGNHNGKTIDPSVDPATLALTPVQIAGLMTSNIKQISAGNDHTCALDDQGRVFCWGQNGSGQLGHNSNTDDPNPTQVNLGGVQATQVVASNGFSCAIAGNVKCWGDNSRGELGNGGGGNSSSPVDTGLAGATQLASGNGASVCALVGGGAIKCWGANNRGQLGIAGSTTDQNSPMPSAITSGATQLVGGAEHFCAQVGADVECWGSNQFGILADMTLTDSSTPKVVSGLTGGTLASGQGAVYYLMPNMGIRAWGGNYDGQLGRVTSATSAMPTTPPNLPTDATTVSPGYTTCSITTTGTNAARCHGLNSNGQLGDTPSGTPQNKLTPSTPLASSVNFISSGAHVCALGDSMNAKQGYCWGPNNRGQIGNGNQNEQDSPQKITSLAQTVEIGVGRQHTCSLNDTGNVRCWGDNGAGQVGTGTNQNFFNTPQGPVWTNVAHIAVGAYFSCGVNMNSSVKCWGGNTYGQIGDGTTTTRNQPPTQATLDNNSNAVAVVVGFAHACARISPGDTAMCWGYNHDGELGRGATTEKELTPAPVPNLTGVIALTAGDQHTCALMSGGGVMCWGSNRFGQLGDGTYISKSTPVEVVLPAASKPVKAVKAGLTETYVLGADNKWLQFGRMIPFATTPMQ